MADDKKIIFSMVGVSKIYPPQKQVLKDIYLSFYYGAKIGILGLNGAGKSTLMKIIAGIEKSFNGEVVFSPGYTVGYLSQEPEFDHEKTAKENDCPFQTIGVVSGAELTIKVNEKETVSTDVSQLEHAWKHSLENQLEAKTV